MSKDYGSWSLADLKNELRRRNARVVGKKAVLVQRLEDYDKLFGPLMTDSASCYKINTPGPEHFRDINSDSVVPVLNQDNIDLFCVLSQRDDISKAKNMYEEHFLHSCRVAREDNTYFYLAGVCASEFRKQVLYNVTVKAKDHLILEAQCECAAGIGPFAQCKHILVLLCGILEFIKQKTIKLKTSCTGTLQTFHWPKKIYSGNPITAESLTLKFKNEQYKAMCSFDPRSTAEDPRKFKEAFKNKVVKYCGHEGVTMPIAELIKPANIPAVYSDHDYIKKTAEEEFLEALHLTEDGRNKFEKKTLLDKKFWLSERLKRMHSSNFGTICKRTQQFKKLAHSLLKPSDVSTAGVRHGIQYEEAIHKFEDLTKLETVKCCIIVCKNKQFLACTPDRLVGNNCLLEVKCPYSAKNESISPENVKYLYLCEQTGLLKLNEQHNYYYQIQGQLMCTERAMAYFCVYTVSDLKVLLIKRNNDFIDKMLVKLTQFYDE